MTITSRGGVKEQPSHIHASKPFKASCGVLAQGGIFLRKGQCCHPVQRRHDTTSTVMSKISDDIIGTNNDKTVIHNDF